MAAFEVLALDTATPQIRAPGAADTYSFPRAITPSGANVTPITVSGYSLTGANAQSMFDLSGTWNTTGTPTGIKFNITDTASNAASLLMDLQTGGSTRFNVRKDGQVVAGLIAVNSATYSFAGDTTTGWGYRQSGFLAAICSGSEILRIGGGSVDGLSNTIGSSNGGGLGVGSGGVFDVFLRRDAANTLAQRNGTNAQTFRVYNTFTDASNYERLSVDWTSNVAYIRPQNAGTGSARLFVPVTGSTTVASLPAAATAGAGARAFVTDATVTIFASTVAGGGANKVPVVSDGTNWIIG